MFKSLQARLTMMVVGIALCATVTILVFVRNATNDAVLVAEEEALQLLLETALISLDTEYQSIEFHKKTLLAKHKDSLEDLMSLALSVIERKYREFKIGGITEQEAKRNALKSLKELRYDDGVGYFWINDTTQPIPRMVMHPTKPFLDGKILDEATFNCAQPNNKNLFQACVETCLARGHGFVEYQWSKPGTGGLSQKQSKLSYVELFKPWGWVIGTGMYIDDIERHEQERLRAVLRELKQTLTKVKVAQTGYMFVFTGDRQMLVHPSLEGANFNTLKNPSTGNLMLDDLMAAAHGKGSLKYLWEKPPLHRGDFSFMKLSYVRHFKPLDWYIASSVYYDEVSLPAQTLANKIILIATIFLAATIILGIGFARTITRPLRNLVLKAREIEEKGLTDIEIPEEGTLETRTLARVSASMLKSIRKGMEEKEGLLKALEASNAELKFINAQLKVAKHEADKASQLKSQFVSNVSHEIRTPLNGIIGFTEQILKKPEEPQAIKKSAEIILKESESLLHLINDILDNAKIEAGMMELDIRPTDLREILKDVENTARIQAEKKNLSLRFSLDIGVSRFCLVDPLRLKQILLNLVNNAIKFTAKGSVIVAIDKLDADIERQMVKFSVIDTGIGIPDDKLPVIFEPFAQADGSTTRLYGGTGLGTTIVKQLVEKMSGTLGVESEIGSGSTFWFIIPLKTIAEEVAKEVFSSENKQEVEEEIGGNILLAEDYATNQMLIKTHLEAAGYQVALANDGSQAVKLARKEKYDLILMDVQMPNMDGFEATHEIRSYEGPNQNTPIVGLTASPEQRVKTQCIMNGMNAVASKPIREAPFIKLVSNWIKANR